MKKCPTCGSIAQDQDYVCGVCGGDLSAAVEADQASLDQPVAVVETPSRRSLNKKALLTVLAGPIISLVGLVLAVNPFGVESELVALSGIVILAIGLLVISGTLGGFGLSFRTFRGWIFSRKAPYKARWQVRIA